MNVWVSAYVCYIKAIIFVLLSDNEIWNKHCDTLKHLEKHWRQWWGTHTLKAWIG